MKDLVFSLYNNNDNNIYYYYYLNIYKENYSFNFLIARINNGYLINSMPLMNST